MPVSGEFRRPGGEFLFHVEKEPKDARGQAQIDFGCASADMTLVPWTPILRGPPMRRFSVDAKARVAQHVVAKSAQLRFRLTAKTAPAPLLLLSNANPLVLGFALGTVCGGLICGTL